MVVERMDKKSIAERILAVIREKKILRVRSIDTKSALDQCYGLDSVGMISLIIALEEDFSIEFDDYELQLERLSTVDQIAGLLMNKLEKSTT
jgi:acyl carrier protein